jgi:hypothetical protein
VQPAGLAERRLRRAQPIGQLRITSTATVVPSASGAMSDASSSIVARPQTPHELLATMFRRCSSIAGTRAAASPRRNTSTT